ncbi:MAG: NUDIX domain-containing protein, partial [Alphaproteobacteria bacterium]|nr:NUDIX domain-containing protein [Alphaproteobacteria bacterium]
MAQKPEAGCGAAIFDDDGRLLLIQRLTEPESGAWGLPGGKIDFGEP